jgi:hypothetical protein
MGAKNVYVILDRTLLGKSPAGERRLDEHIKFLVQLAVRMGDESKWLRVIRRGNWSQRWEMMIMTQDHVQQRALVLAVLSLRVRISRELFSYVHNCYLLKEDTGPRNELF